MSVSLCDDRTMHDERPLIGAARAAELLSITRPTLTRQVRAGLVPLRARLESGVLVFDRERIELLAGERIARAEQDAA